MFQAALLETMKTALAPWRTAVSISMALMPKAPSPLTEITCRSGIAKAAERKKQEEAAAAEGDIPVVGFMKIVSHPALDAEQQGVKDALAEAGYIEGETVRFIEGNARTQDTRLVRCGSVLR